MKVCLECGCRSHGEDWKCPKCGYSPEYHCGYLAFVHDLPGAEDNFDIKYFPKLTEVEDGNFWFESRNRLIIYTLQDYFPNAERFLEIGCGTGFVLSGIKREIPDLIVSGSEIYNEALAFARKRLPDVTLFQMDACRIPFENEFDVIGAFDVIEHIEEDEIVLSQIFRALKSEGGTIITVPQHQWLWSVNDEIACHKRRYSRKELVGKMEDVGFRII